MPPRFAMPAHAPPALHNVVVYVTPDKSEASQIWRARLDGSHRKRLASGLDPALSPDGRWIAFGGGSYVLVMPAAGGAAKRAYTFTGKNNGPHGAPIWAPDSQHLAVGTIKGCIVLDLFSRRAHGLRGRPGCMASFSPDSRTIVYDGNDDDLYLASTGGGAAVRLTHDHSSYVPVWGKSGIAFLFTRDNDSFDLRLLDETTHHVRRLTRAGLEFLPAFFSADGKELLANQIPPREEFGNRVWAFDVATGTKRFITGGAPAGLSADGKTALVEIDSPCYLETVPLAGGKPHVIVRGPCDASWNAR